MPEPAPASAPAAPEALLLFAVFFGPLAFGCVEPWSLAILESAFFLMAAWVAYRRGPIAHSPIHKTLLPAAAALLSIGVIQRLNPAPVTGPLAPLLPFTASGPATSRALLLWSSYAALLWAAPQALAGTGARRRLAWSVFLAGAAVAALGLWQQTGGNRHLYGLREVGVYHQPFGPFYNHNHAASFMVLSALAGLGIFFSRFSAWRHERGLGDVYDLAATQLLIFMLISLLVLGIARSDSRMGLYSLLAAGSLGLLLTMAASRKKGSRLAIFAGLAAAAAGGFIFVNRNPRYLKPLAELQRGASARSLGERLAFNRSGLEMLRDSPATGFGLGAFAHAFALYQDPVDRRDDLWARAEHLHNDWLELLLETGPAGLAAAAAGLAVLAFRIISCIALSARPVEKIMTTWFFCAGAAFLLHCLVDFCSHIPAVMTVFLALAAAAGGPAGEGRPPREPLSPPASRAAALVCLLLLLPALPALVSSWYLFKGGRGAPEARPPLVAKAAAWDPRPENFHRLGGAWMDSAQAAAEGSPERRERLREALRASGAALRQDPPNSNFRSRLGTILWGLGRPEEGERFRRWR